MELLEKAQINKGQAYFADLEKQYMIASQNIEKELTNWYSRFATNNNITLIEAKRLLTTKELAEFKWNVTEYIKYGEENALNQKWMKELENASARVHVSRLESLKVQMQQQVEVLYGNQTDGFDKLLKDVYTDGYFHTAYEIQRGFNIGWDLHDLNSNQLDKVLSKPWTTDGKTFSDRIWTHKQQLLGDLQTGLTQTVIRGEAPDKLIKNISERFRVNKNKAGRLVMTESAAFASASQKDCFNDLDVEKYEILATLDNKTSAICQELDGKVISMKDYEVGVTAPPFHTWCRTTTIPYFEDNYGERSARDADGNVYYIPSNIKYPEWKEKFVDGGSKNGLKEVNPIDMMKGKNDEVQALKKSIMDKHKNIVNTKEHEVELDSILSKHSSKELNLYDKLSNKFSSNEYHGRSSAAYYPHSKMVKMNIKNNDWERKVRNGNTAAWHTKFHEEFHQLDHILSQSKFGLQPDGNVSPYKNLYTQFTGGNTVIGQQMIKSIDDDILAVVNKSIDWYNENEGLSIKHLKSLNRISSDAYKSTIRYLKTTYDTDKTKAQIAMFTDAMGLSTRNRLNPHGNGFWGHDAPYNKDRSKDGAASETWATFGSLFYTGDAETISLVKGLMPNTWETYSSVLEDVLEYALTNDIDYK